MRPAPLALRGGGSTGRRDAGDVMLAHSSPSVSADMPVASAGPLRRRVGVPTALTRAYRAGWCRARVESLARALGDSLVEAAGQQTQIAARSLAEPWPRSC